MLVRTMTYKDFNEVERTEDFRFNLTGAEIAEMEMSVNGSYSEMLKMLVEKHDTPATATIFRNLILKAYGEKSLDGQTFMKSKEISENFAHTQAYSDLYMELVTDADAASNFVNGILPKDLLKNMPK